MQSVMILFINGLNTDTKYPPFRVINLFFSVKSKAKLNTNSAITNVCFCSAVPLPLYQISLHFFPYTSPTGESVWRSVLMRYLRSLLLACNIVNVRFGASNPHGLEQSFICHPVSVFWLDVLHCWEAALTCVSAPKHAGHWECSRKLASGSSLQNQIPLS